MLAIVVTSIIFYKTSSSTTSDSDSKLLTFNFKESTADLSPSNMSSIIQKTSPIDFFIQDVCLDKSNKVIIGASPLDIRCVTTRDLAVGEPLPYHKTDNPDDVEERLPKKGDIRFDAIPFQTVLGIAAADIADGPNSNSKYWTYDNGPDAIHMYAASKNSVYHVFSLDHSGPYRQVTEHCMTNTTEPDASVDGNGVVGLIDGKFGAQISGAFKNLTAKYVNTSGSCPEIKNPDGGSTAIWKFDINQWSVIGSPGVITPPLLTLYNVASKDPTSSHVETVFHTREFGQIRHETWKNIANPEWKDEDVLNFKKSQAKIISDRLCDTPAPKQPFPNGPGSEWILVSCRQETKIIAPYSPNGDSPSVWIEALKNIELSAPLVGAPLPSKPIINSISSTKGEVGSTFKIFGKNFSPTSNTVIFGKSCIVGKFLPATESSGEMSISVTIPDTCKSTDMKYCSFNLSVVNGSAFSDSKEFIYTVLSPNGIQGSEEDCRKSAGK
jgi:hypothetical protein